VKPAVEMDGGAIQFKKFENGVVTLCSGLLQWLPFINDHPESGN
jgi:hypothetical protein